MKGRVLIAAGSDSGGGAGIQADIKAVTALGGFAMTAITALTAQNTEGVHGIHEVDPGFVRRQMQVVLQDLGADAVKTGMLHRRAVVEAVADALAADAPGVPLVVDPVMVAKGGARLLDEDTVAVLQERLLPLASLLTPNAPEAEVLAGMKVADAESQAVAARRLLALGPAAVLVKGGHLPGPVVRDCLADAGGIHWFEDVRLDTRSTHGTGCTMASAIATGLGQGLDLAAAVRRARIYVQRAIATAPGFGRGHGPLNHGHTVRPMDGAA
ncbi:bifunctional hydroxymethylpyrimidine kinase/phosphomethylpyrimidine kinase [Marinibaculum pumilum]|uniref:hydroxymethylpyrimidine kinase n=1 Tax=Marinibaculum pumilum TaxID=1766165 RepID=A0ABV7L7G7_9PROT